ncbi:MAG: 4Fe-4S binding protein [Treponema sp.]|jgi:ferredoxin|nr:4Fe-4S binding protein [Treponema sp.]
MKRRVIKINRDVCNGCGLCVTACHEGAIGLRDGKAVLLREDYCDGLGNCLPVCPAGAISFEEREAAVFKPETSGLSPEPLLSGAAARPVKSAAAAEKGAGGPKMDSRVPSRLNQWPIQIKLAPVNAPYFEGADLLVSADCCAYAYGNFHNDFIKDRITLIGCPKLDGIDYSEKLSAILAANNIRSLTVTRMEVPCCRAIEQAAADALKNHGGTIPRQLAVITIRGEHAE